MYNKNNNEEGGRSAIEPKHIIIITLDFKIHLTRSIITH